MSTNRTASGVFAWILAAALMAPIAFSDPLGASVAPAFGAQQDDPEQADERPETAETDDGDAQESKRELRRERRKAAKEARIEAYRARKEERRKRKEAERAAAEAERAAPAEAAASDDDRDLGSGEARPDRERAPSGVDDRDVLRVAERLSDSRLASDPTAAHFLSIARTGDATPDQVARLGNIVARNAYLEDAIVLYSAVLDREPDNREILMNLGNVRLQQGDLSGAERAFRKVVKLEKTHARAHFGLGMTYQEANDYEAAIEAYRTALTLDPSLGDPEVNPLAATNELLLPVKLMLYGQQSTTLALPLEGGANDDSDDRR